MINSIGHYTIYTRVCFFHKNEHNTNRSQIAKLSLRCLPMSYWTTEHLFTHFTSVNHRRAQNFFAGYVIRKNRESTEVYVNFFFYWYYNKTYKVQIFLLSAQTYWTRVLLLQYRCLIPFFTLTYASQAALVNVVFLNLDLTISNLKKARSHE